MRYHITTYGCQMNVADSRRLAAELEKLGYLPAARAEEADVIVLNTCVVRQRPEDRATSRLLSLRPVKQHRPETVIALMGCLVGVKRPDAPLRRKFPFVDAFLAPSDPGPLINLLIDRDTAGLQAASRAQQDALQDGELVLPRSEQGRLVSAFLPIVLGCSHACAFCIIPQRRGPERSRPPAEVLAEARALAHQGVKEITLLGQIVDRYGLDLAEKITLAGLLHRLHEIDGLERIRFLTSHPNWITGELLDTVAGLPKVCEHIEVPIQAADDEILRAMKRGYTADAYRQLIARIRRIIPKVAVHTDIIVGFPGETEDQFRRTYDLLAELRLDKAHIARYSPRPETLSSRKMEDDVPEKEKEHRRKALDDLQAEIVGEINGLLVGTEVRVLVEGQYKGRWRGRTRGNKLVYIEDQRDLRGQLVDARISWAGPWSMQGTAAKRSDPRVLVDP